MNLDKYNSLSFEVDANKLLVPTPPWYTNGVITKGLDANNMSPIQGIFSSFTDAPGGFNEEYQEIIIH